MRAFRRQFAIEVLQVREDNEGWGETWGGRGVLVPNFRLEF